MSASKTKLAPSEKPKIVSLDHVPDVLGSNFYSYEKIRLLSSDGKLAVFYKNTGSILLANIHDKDTKMIKSTNNLLCSELYHPHLYSILDNDSIQILNYESGVCDKYQQEKDTVKKVQALLIDSQKLFCITANTVYIWFRDRLDQPPRVIPLKDARDPNTRTIINVNHSFSSIVSSNRLLLGNADVFQVWEISDTKQEMFMVFEGRNPNSTEKYYGIYFTPDNTTVITTNKNTFMVWDTAKPKKAAENPKEMKEEDIITAVAVDDSFIVIGTCTGLLSLWQRTDGEPLYPLNTAVESAATTKKDESSLFNYNVANKVNCISKVGRWVFAGFENSRLAAYDITQSHAQPVLEFFHSKSSAIKSILIENDVIIMTIKQAEFNDKKSKEKSKKLKPDIGIWVPLSSKVPGLEFYSQRIASAREKCERINSATLPVAYSYSRITSYMQDIESAGEDVTEFTSVLDRASEIIGVLERNPELAVGFQKLKDVQVALDEFESTLAKLTQTGRLIRFFTSNRLRRGIEIQNSALHAKLNELEPLLRAALEEKKKALGLVKPHMHQYATVPKIEPVVQPSIQRAQRSNTEKFLEHENMIADASGREWWRKSFGVALMVEWENFVQALGQYFPGHITTIEARQLQSILDLSNTGYISQYKFSEFLKGFGPFDNCVVNVKHLLAQKWFHGWLSSRESELLFRTGYVSDGTFLVRFSKSKPGSFALAFVKGSSVKHILIESNMPEGFKISEQETSGTTRVFKTLDEIIFHYKFVLKIPYTDTLSHAPWFHGDLSTDEANELLLNQPSGTFLLRFSSKGSFAASFVDSTKAIRHVLINTVAKNQFVVHTGDGETMSFASIRDLVTYYQSKSVFTIPLKTTNR